MRRRLLIHRTFKATSLAVTSLAVGPTASGFWRPNTANSGCLFAGNAEIQYFLSNAGTHDWDGPRVEAFEQGAETWEVLRGEGSTAGTAGPVLLRATRLFTEPTTYAANQFRVILDSSVGTAGTSCTTNPHRIRVNNMAVGTELRYLAAHEIGHGFGIRHSGINDNLTTSGTLFGPTGSTPGPLMSGCVRPAGSGYELPKVDDFASLTHKRSSSSVTPNGGFESSGWSRFRQQGSTAVDTAVRYRGLNSGRINGVGNLAQRVRITQPTGTLTFRVRYKTNSPNSNFKGSARRVTQPTTDLCPGTPSWPTSSWVVVANEPINNAATWASRSITSPDTWSIFQSADVEISVTNSSANTTLWVDNLAAVNS